MIATIKCGKGGYCLAMIHNEEPNCVRCLKVNEMLRKRLEYFNKYGVQLGLKMYERYKNAID